MKKKIVILLVAVLFLILIFVLAVYMKGKLLPVKVSPVPAEKHYPTATSQANWKSVIEKPIIPEYMKEEEKVKLHISTSTNVNPARIQVLTRDKDGNISAYKLIYSNEDVVTSETVH